MTQIEPPFFLKSFVNHLAAQPMLFDILRWILEAGYKGEKKVLKQEGAFASKSVLDIGCGTGALAKIFLAETYVGVDPNPDYIKRARYTKPKHQFLVMDGRCLEWQSNWFDTAIIGGVLHHLPDEDSHQILGEARRVLKPKGGRLIIWEDIPARNPFNWMGRLVHSLDEGDFIRTPDEYLSLIRNHFDETRHYFMASGVCDYLVVVGK